MELQNKVALITGASSGIGASIAQDLDTAGMKLILTARSQDKLDQLAASLKNAKTFATVITDADAPQKLLDFAIATFGQLDIVINNAGAMTDNIAVFPCLCFQFAIGQIMLQSPKLRRSRDV